MLWCLIGILVGAFVIGATWPALSRDWDELQREHDRMTRRWDAMMRHPSAPACLIREVEEYLADEEAQQ